MQTQCPQAAPPKLLKGSAEIKNFAGPLSDAAKNVILESKLPVNLLAQTFYGYGIYDRSELVPFFLGARGSRWSCQVSNERLDLLMALQARVASSGHGILKLFLGLTSSLCMVKLHTQYILVYDLQERTRIRTIGSAKPQWLVCFWDPILQQRRKGQLSSGTVARFIRTMRTLNFPWARPLQTGVSHCFQHWVPLAP